MALKGAFYRSDTPNKKWDFDPLTQLSGDPLTPKGFQMPVVRILAMRDIARHNVKEGDVGGWIDYRIVEEIDSGELDESVLTEILPDEGDAWLGINAALIRVNKSLYPALRGNALLRGEINESTGSKRTKPGTSKFAILHGGFVKDNAQVTGDVYLAFNAQVSGDAKIYGRKEFATGKRGRRLETHAVNIGYSTSHYEAEDYRENPLSWAPAWMSLPDREMGNRWPAIVKGSATVSGEVTLRDFGSIDGNASIKGRVELGPSSIVSDDAEVSSGLKLSRVRCDLIIENTIVKDSVKLETNGLIRDSQIMGSSMINGLAKFSSLQMSGSAMIDHNLEIPANKDLLIKNQHIVPEPVAGRESIETETKQDIADWLAITDAKSNLLTEALNEGHQHMSTTSIPQLIES